MKKTDHKKGFSLVELMVASALFMTVVAVAASSFLAILDASIESREMNTLMSNVDFALEDISRNIRLGENFTITGGSQIGFDIYAADSAGNISETKCRVTYQLLNGVILKSKAKIEGPDDCDEYSSTAITSNEIIVDSLIFTGSQLTASSSQPRVTINLSGRIVGEIEQEFSLQTSVTQRILNI